MPARRDLPHPDVRHEYALAGAYGFTCIAGVDEAGRGAWAGPVFAGVVCLPFSDASAIAELAGVRDSKLLTPLARLGWVERIQAVARAAAVGSATPDEIDALGISPATHLAVRRALAAAETQLGSRLQALLLDMMHWPTCPLPHRALVRGDQVSLSIAAASILAKVARDQVMIEAAVRYPLHGFERHKGYGTLGHQAALAQHGVTPLHRRSFAPIRALTQGLL